MQSSCRRTTIAPTLTGVCVEAVALQPIRSAIAVPRVTFIGLWRLIMKQK